MGLDVGKDAYGLVAHELTKLHAGDRSLVGARVRARVRVRRLGRGG